MINGGIEIGKKQEKYVEFVSDSNISFGKFYFGI
mgnify:CR=1 FL=1|jgi:hypothetical protein